MFNYKLFVQILGFTVVFAAIFAGFYVLGGSKSQAVNQALSVGLLGLVVAIVFALPHK